MNYDTVNDDLIVVFSDPDLSDFSSAHKVLVAELLSLPVRSDTLSVRSRRAHLDCRLSEMEEAIKIFSRDKVYIKTNS